MHLKLFVIFLVGSLADDKIKTCEESITCHKAIPYNFTADDRRLIVTEHNRYRHEVASGLASGSGWNWASNMNILHYDYHLEHQAKCAAKVCNEYEHKTIFRDKNGAAMSYNRYHTNKAHHNNQLLIKQVIASWYRGKRYARKEEIDPYIHSPLWSEFTQLVWANTLSIGCAATSYRKQTEKLIFYCFYYPPGNLIGEWIYVPGFPATNCANNTRSLVYNTLCDPIQPNHSHHEELISASSKLAYPANVLVILKIFALLKLINSYNCY